MSVNSNHPDPRNGDPNETCDSQSSVARAAATEGVVTSLGVWGSTVSK
jgi:hypothetical protein